MLESTINRIKKDFSTYNKTLSNVGCSIDKKHFYEFVKVVYEAAELHDIVDQIYCVKSWDENKIKNKLRFLSYDQGVFIPHLMFLSPNGLYCAKGYFRNKKNYFPIKVWENITPEKNVIRWYTDQIKTPYPQSNLAEKIPKSKYLFLMQGMVHIPPHTKCAEETYLFAMENKIPVLFKGHPTSAISIISSETAFTMLQKKYGKSEYITYVDSKYSVDSLLDRVEAVYSSDSLGCFNFVLHGKKAATELPNNFSEVVPIVNHISELEDVKPVDTETLSKFLTWYKNSFTINILEKNWKERVHQKIKLFSENATIEEMLSYGDQC